MGHTYYRHIFTHVTHHIMVVWERENLIYCRGLPIYLKTWFCLWWWKRVELKKEKFKRKCKEKNRRNSTNAMQTVPLKEWNITIFDIFWPLWKKKMVINEVSLYSKAINYPFLSRIILMMDQILADGFKRWIFYVLVPWY